MPVPDPPFSTPRIMKVLEPSAGQYEVVVRMDPTLASKFPDKPFGTDLSAIGLAKKDSDKYPGYTLVAIEPADKGGKDHLWIFQKLSGPEWTTTSNSRDNLTPAKYRDQTVVVKTEQEVAPATAPTALTGDLVSSVVTQVPNTGKAVLTEVTETIDENAATLVGQQAYIEGAYATTEESLVEEGVDAATGFNIASSRVTPLGNGKSVKETVTVPTWPTLTSQEWDHELNAPIIRTETMVTPGSGIGQSFTTVKAINVHRSMMITETPPLAALNAYHLIVPGTHPADDLPEVVDVSVAWNESSSGGDGVSHSTGFAEGDSWSLSLNSSANSSSSVSVDPAINVSMNHIIGRTLLAEHHFFFLPLTSTGAAVLAAAGATGGVYPGRIGIAHTITAIGMKATVGVTASCGQSAHLSANGSGRVISSGRSSDRSLSTSTQFIQIPPCTGVVSINESKTQSVNVTASALMPSGSNWNALSLVNTDSISVTGMVVGGAGGDSSAPSGSYAVAVSCDPYKWGYMKCHVKVVHYT